MDDLRYTITGQHIAANGRSFLASGAYGYLYASFTFSADWAGLTRTALFQLDEDASQPVLLDVENRCLVPQAALSHAGRLRVGVCGAADGVLTTVWAERIDVREGAVVEGEGTPDEVTWYEQITGIMQQQAVDALAAQTAQAGAEGDRATAEGARVTAEQGRATAESLREEAETERVEAESTREDAFTVIQNSAVTFNGLDVPEVSIALEDKTDTPRANSLTYTLPAATVRRDVFVKIVLPASVASAGSFLLLNNSFTYPVGVSQVSGGTCTISYRGTGIGIDNIPYSTTYYLRAYNDSTFTHIELWGAPGVKLQSYTYEEAILLPSVRFLTGTGVLCYDVIAFNDVISDDLAAEYFYGVTRNTLVESFGHNGKTFRFKALAHNVLFVDGEAAETKVMRLDRLHGKKLACFGDSLTGNYNAPTDYPSYIGDITGMTVYNVGVGGTRMAYDGAYTTYDAFCMVKITDALASGDWTLQDAAYSGLTIQGKAQVDRLKTIDLSEIDHITLFFGTNDFTGSEGVDNESDAMDITYFSGATRYVLDKLLTAFSALKITLVAPIYRDRLSDGDGLNSDDNAYGGTYLHEYVDKLAEIAKAFHLPCLELYYNSGINKYTASTYLSDGLHPTVLGRQVIASKISGFIATNW